MDPDSGRLIHHEPARTFSHESPVEIGSGNRTFVFRPQRSSDLKTDSGLRHEGFVRKRQDPSPTRNSSDPEEVTHSRTGDPELIRQKAIEPLAPSIGFDLNGCRFHFSLPPIRSPKVRTLAPNPTTHRLA